MIKRFLVWFGGLFGFEVTEKKLAVVEVPSSQEKMVGKITKKEYMRLWNLKRKQKNQGKDEDESKAIISKKTKKRKSKLTPSQRYYRKKKNSERKKKWWDSRTPEQREIAIHNAKQARHVKALLKAQSEKKSDTTEKIEKKPEDIRSSSTFPDTSNTGTINIDLDSVKSQDVDIKKIKFKDPTRMVNQIHENVSNQQPLIL